MTLMRLTTRTSLVSVVFLASVACGPKPAPIVNPDEIDTSNLGPTDPMEKAARHMERGELDEASEIIERELAKYPDDHELHFARGVVAQNKGDAAAALASWEKVLELKPEFEPALGGIGALLLEQGEPDRAIEMFTRSLQANPEFAEGHYNLALALVQAGRLEDGIKSMETARQLAGDDVEVAVELATLYASAGRLDDAVAAARTATEMAPADPRGHLVHGQLLSRAGQHDAAIQSLRLAVQKASDDDGVGMALAQALVRSGRKDHLEEAIRMLEAYAKAYDKALVWSELGSARAKAGDTAAALVDFERALAKNPTLPSASVRRVGALSELGRCKEAKQAAASLKADQVGKGAKAAANKAAAGCKKKR
jgi:tetratricopeptide (TPR) repeat protein